MRASAPVMLSERRARCGMPWLLLMVGVGSYPAGCTTKNPRGGETARRYREICGWVGGREGKGFRAATTTTKVAREDE
jgi:hypothetical protein